MNQNAKVMKNIQDVVKIIEIVWKCMKAFEIDRKSTEFNENVWNRMKILWNQMKCNEICGNALKFD